jgi:hypothetical protein
MKYKAYLKQDGEGCDYTIGCGQTIYDIEASSLVEATERFFEIIKQEYSGEERRLDSAEIYEVATIVEVDVKGIYKRIDDAEAKELAKRKEEAEKKEFERLQVKFGSK